MLHNACTFAILVTLLASVASTQARSIDTPVDQAPNTEAQLLAQIKLAHSQNPDRNSRIKRQSYGSSDYYNNYYNDYYSNYYANQNKVSSTSVRRPPPPPPAVRPNPTANRFDSNRFDSNSNRVDVANDDFDRGDYNQQQQQQQQQQQIYNGQRYTYTPIFQYKSTHGKHEKLFVPNIFG